MEHNENLLVVALEECSEVQKEISKALRFGIDNCPPDEPNITNGELILKEYYQLCAVMDMILEQGIITDLPELKKHKIYTNKKIAVKKWEDYSRTVGTVN